MEFRVEKKRRLCVLSENSCQYVEMRDVAENMIGGHWDVFITSKI